MKYSPIFIPTLCRHNHFRVCVESLGKNKDAKESVLYIALDYPINDSQWDGYKKILKYIKTIKGFKLVHVIKRTENYGAKKNFLEGKKEVFKKYDRIIVSEDDNEFSPNFLEYTNKGLLLYEENKMITAICGHRHLFPVPKDYRCNYYFSKGFSAWGYGMWRDRYKKFVYTPNELKTFIYDKSFIQKIKIYYPSFYKSILSYIIKNQDMFGDGTVAIDMVRENTYCVYPTVSKVRNHGHDGSGVNCGNMSEDLYSKQTIDSDSQFDYLGKAIIEDTLIVNAQREYYREGVIVKIKTLILRFLIILGITIK